VARAIGIVHTCGFDAWAAYDDIAVGTRLGGSLRRPAAEHTEAVNVGRQFKDSPFAIGRGAKTARRSRQRKKPRISAETRKIYQAQGRYMAAVRPLAKEARAKVKAIREKSGVRWRSWLGKGWPVECALVSRASPRVTLSKERLALLASGDATADGTIEQAERELD
jgi:hypothetical protein